MGWFLGTFYVGSAVHVCTVAFGLSFLVSFYVPKVNQS